MADLIPILIHPENRLLGAPGGDFGFAAAPFSFADYQPAVTQGGAQPVQPANDPAPVTSQAGDLAVAGGSEAAPDHSNGAATAFSPPADNFGGAIAPVQAPDALTAATAQSPLAPVSLFQPIGGAGTPADSGEQGPQPAGGLAANLAANTPATPSAEASDTLPAAVPALATSLPVDEEITVATPSLDVGEALPDLNFLPGLTAPSLTLPVLPAVELPGVGEVSGLLEATTGPLSDVTETLENDVVDLLGADPAGGVTTLVSLVSIADVFDLRQVDEAPPPVAEEPVINLLDALGAEPPAAVDPDDDSDAADALPIPLPVPVPVPLPPVIDTDPIGGLL